MRDISGGERPRRPDEDTALRVRDGAGHGHGLSSGCTWQCEPEPEKNDCNETNPHRYLRLYRHSLSPNGSGVGLGDVDGSPLRLARMTRRLLLRGTRRRDPG